MTEEKLKVSLWERLQGHFQEHIAKYAVLATAILVPLSGALAKAAATIGPETKVGTYLLAGASALGTAAAAVVYIRNLGIWQMLDQFGSAPGIGKLIEQVPVTPARLATGGTLLVSDPDDPGGTLPVSPDIERPAAVSPEQTDFPPPGS